MQNFLYSKIFLFEKFQKMYKFFNNIIRILETDVSY